MIQYDVVYLHVPKGCLTVQLKLARGAK